MCIGEANSELFVSTKKRAVFGRFAVSMASVRCPFWRAKNLGVANAAVSGDDGEGRNQCVALSNRERWTGSRRCDAVHLLEAPHSASFSAVSECAPPPPPLAQGRERLRLPHACSCRGKFLPSPRCLFTVPRQLPSPKLSSSYRVSQ